MQAWRWTVVVGCMLFVVVPSVADAQIGDSISIPTQTCSYFGEGLPESVVQFQSDAEAEGVIDRIIDASGLVRNFEIRAAGVPNAAAVIQGATRYILYNQHFIQETKRRTNSEWGPISIMAHEIGHHLNGHTLDSGGSRPRLELESDYYSGFVLQRMGASLDQARIAMELLGSSSASPTHPAKHDRLAAITNGWQKSCESDPDCGNPVRVPERSSPEPRREVRERPKGPDSCEYAFDDMCDEPNLCERGTDTTDCEAEERARSRRRDSGRERASALYCCDQWGRKWCQIAVNPGPVGSPCWCSGVPGTGLICR